MVVTIASIFKRRSVHLLSVGACDSNHKLVSSSPNVSGVTILVLGVNCERIVGLGTSTFDTRSRSGGVLGRGSSSAFSFVLQVVTEIRNVSHNRVLIRSLVNIDRINQRLNIIFISGDIDGTLQIINRVASRISTIQRTDTRFKRVAKSSQDLTVTPGGCKVLWLSNSIWFDLLFDPLQKDPLGGTFLNTALDLVTKNESPNQTKSNTDVSFEEITGTNVDNLQTLRLDKFKSGV
mmetsp:Transcript_21744/g.29892  ORF Transcript_21744/g.29892 Transcript_21744/m.29892 type:complete len:235 (-) Transcript_21744:278-982(-)